MLQNEGTIQVEIVNGRSRVRVMTNGDGKEYVHPNVRLKSVCGLHVFIGFSSFWDIRRAKDWKLYEIMTVNSKHDIYLTNILLHKVEAHVNITSKSAKPV